MGVFYNIIEKYEKLIKKETNRNVRILTEEKHIGLYKRISDAYELYSRRPMRFKPSDIEYIQTDNITTKIFFSDGTKETVKIKPGELYDMDKAVMFCILKRLAGSGNQMRKIFNVPIVYINREENLDGYNI